MSTNNDQTVLSSSSPSTSPFLLTTSELKQTLLGSFIGAVSVVLIVGLLVCAVKTTRSKLFGDKSSRRASCAHRNESGSSEKTTTTTTTTAASSSLPYELGKLSLQTLCINSTGCSSASSASSSSSSAASSSNETSSSCVCGGGQQQTMANRDHHHTHSQHPTADIFTKMDPLRLTLISQNLLSTAARSSFHQNYLNPSSYLHYLATNTADMPPQSSSSPPPSSNNLNTSTPNNNNDSNSDNKKQTTTTSYLDNTYDKLHQQRSTANLIRPQAIIPLVKTGGGAALQSQTVFNTLNPNFLNCTSTLSNRHHLNFNNQHQHPHHLVHFPQPHHHHHELMCNPNSLETTPFLIIRSPNNLNLLEENCFNPIAGSFRMSTTNETIGTTTMNPKMNGVIEDDDDSQPQHTYHEIGDVLLQQHHRSNQVNNNNSDDVMTSSKTNEMYI